CALARAVARAGKEGVQRLRQPVPAAGAVLCRLRAGVVVRPALGRGCAGLAVRAEPHRPRHDLRHDQPCLSPLLRLYLRLLPAAAVVARPDRPARPRLRGPLMRLPGRLSAAIEVLDDINRRHRPVAEALKAWGLNNRFAGAGDRAAIGNLVYDAL